MTTYTLRSASPAKTRADAVVVGVTTSSKGPAVVEAAQDVAVAYGRRLRPLLQTLGFTGKAGETAKIPTSGTIASPLLVLVGLGDAAKVDATAVRRAAGVVARTVTNAASLAVALPADSPELVRAVTEGLVLGAYTFDTYKKDTRPESKQPGDVVVLSGIARQGEATAAFERAQQLATAVNRARQWVNLPANDLNPPSMADAIVAQHKEVTKGRVAPKIDVQVWDEKQLADDGCGGILAVGGSSATPPRMVKLTWSPEGATKHVAVIGKGITYDSGGYTIKPPASMLHMKEDMAGAAAAVQTLFLVAQLGLPIKLTAYAPLAENMISGAAMRPGDVLTIRGGTTVEMTNTDAEGRLIMADALVMAAEEKPDVILDIATLTGHMVVALGERVAAIMGTDEIRDALVAAAADAGESVWPMPIPEEMNERIKSSKVADISQHDWVRWGGGLFAAAFLREFVDGIPWGHIDIAGPGFNPGKEHGYTPTGGTGFGVATLVEYLESLLEA
ncbi:leucyl aminopeptidase [Nocardioides guangzhouensis]|uniref:Probable cytosol aminopeptidase n=1 Tax=Nocardioides guangzhouensis TaxID=2497878 RepID=A0A4Q4Z7J3_9ACTN|nr:leucyl aminopeptidase [Nocardioides guangzhouensis]RYP83111.1 leucyl aminopeptidase [Nocardioides guangzhouensis]